MASQMVKTQKMVEGPVDKAMIQLAPKEGVPLMEVLGAEAEAVSPVATLLRQAKLVVMAMLILSAVGALGARLLVLMEATEPQA